MTNIQCPNCQSFDIAKLKGSFTSLGLMMMFVGFFFGGGGEGASSFYGGNMETYMWGVYLLFIGVFVAIFGAIKDYNKKVNDFECKSCKYKFQS